MPPGSLPLFSLPLFPLLEYPFPICQNLVCSLRFFLLLKWPLCLEMFHDLFSTRFMAPSFLLVLYSSLVTLLGFYCPQVVLCSTALLFEHSLATINKQQVDG